MGYLEGLLGGFMDRKYGVEAENRRSGELASERERAVFTHLLNADDPRTAQLALAGLLDSANPRRKAGGLRGWIGETMASPYLQQIQNLSPTVQEEVEVPPPEPRIPTDPPHGVVPASLEAPESAGMPPTSMVQPGAPPPKPTSYFEPTTPFTRMVTRPRQAFLSPIDKYTKEQIAKNRADIEGDVQAYMALGRTRTQAVQQVMIERIHNRGGAAAGSSYAQGGVVPDPDSPTGYSKELYLRSDPSVRTKIPTQPPLTPESAAARAAAVEAARGGAAADVPLTTSQRFDATTKLQESWRKLESPLREMDRQHKLMTVGLDRFKAGDKIGGAQAVLVTFQKILDPSSVVRESEYARSPEGLSLMSRLEGLYERLKEGGAGVPEAELAGMVETARQFMESMKGWHDQERGVIEGTARDYKIDPQRIFGTQGALAPPPPPGQGTATVPTMIIGPDGKYMIKRPGQ